LDRTGGEKGDGMKWLEISLTLRRELADRVAGLLTGFTDQRVSIETNVINLDNYNDNQNARLARVRTFLLAEDATVLEATRQKLENELARLGDTHPVPPPTYTFVNLTPFRGKEWRATFNPLPVGERFIIIPAWLADPTPNPSTPSSPSSPTIRLLLDPGMAFGTGTHPTTQLCLELLENRVRPGDHVLDLGCGSGILSVAALKLGAASALALDIDPEAGRATQENARLNGVSDQLKFRLGSLDAVVKPTDQSLISSLQFSIVIANILAPVILDFIRHGLAATVAPEGTLIISGVRTSESQSVVDALREVNVVVIEQRQSEDWVALAAKLGRA
jgi:ribosomal protein L11 methyltransferase